MAYEDLIYNISLIASADLSAKQYYACKIDSNGQIALAGAGENAIGIIQNKPTSGSIVTVGTLGLSKAVYGGTVTAGQNLMSDSAGKLVTASGTNAVIAIALQGGSANEIHTVCLVTRTSTGTNTKSVISIPITLATITDAVDVLTNFTPGFAGAITSVAFAVTVPVTTAAKATTLNLEIGTTNLTGGVVALTSANCTPLGAVIAGTAITANNTFGATDTISIEASSTTQFSEGAGVLLITLG